MTNGGRLKAPRASGDRIGSAAVGKGFPAAHRKGKLAINEVSEGGGKKSASKAGMKKPRRKK